MAIVHSVPSDKRRPGVFHEFDDTKGSRGLVPQTRRLLVAAMWDGSGDGRATVDTPIQVQDESDADNLFGVGSEAALACRAALKTWQALGVAAQLWAAPVAEPGGGTAGVERFACSGTATAAGDIVIEINGVTIRAGIDNGDAAAAAATALQAAIAGKYDLLPITAAVVASTNVDCTHNQKGVWANDAHYKVVSAPAGLTVTPSQTVAGVGVSDPTTALGNTFSRDYDAVVIGNHLAADITILNTHVDDAWGLSRKRYRHAFLAEVGTIATATTLASSANRKQICLVSAESFKDQTGSIAAAVAAMSLTQEKPNYNYDGTRLTSIVPADDADIYIDSEVETALAGGVTPLTVNEAGETKLERLVTTKTTEGGNTFENLLDLGHSKTVYYLARQVDAAVALMITGNNVDDEFLRDVRSRVLDILDAAEDLGWVHKVEDHKDEVKAEKDATVATRVVVEIPESVVPAAHQVVAKHVLFVE